MNTVALVGRLVRDPELRQGSTGTSICKFTIAVERRYKQPGQPEADFIGCTAFGKPGENLAQYQKKGALIGVVGRIQTSSYDNQQGQRVYRTDVIADQIDWLESRAQAAARQSAGGYGYQPQGGSYQSGGYNQNYNSSYSQQPSYGNNSSFTSFTKSDQNSSAPASGAYSGYQNKASDFGPSDTSDFDNAFDDTESLNIADDDLPF